MPFIYDHPSWSPNPYALTDKNQHLSRSKMSPLNFFRKNSHMSSSKNIGSEELSSTLAGVNLQGDPFRTGVASPATRRPANPPTVSNPFARGTNTPSEPPPKYTPAAATVVSTTDNPYAFLATFDTVFLIDDSGSMAGSKWRETGDALKAITPICTKHDRDGIDIYFLNTPDSPTYEHVTSAERVDHIFKQVRPGGGTPTGQRLNAILRPYLKRCEQAGKNHIEDVKPLNIIVLTDGEAHDDPESVILNAAKKLDKLEAPTWQLGIQFFQVGNDPEATKALNDLDDGLQDLGCERDIVDTVPWRGADSGVVGLNAEGILKVVLGAVHRRLDRKRNSAEWRPVGRS